MFGPKTKAEALKYRYGAWAGNPQGQPYDPKCCAESVFPHERGAVSHQCNKSPGHGPDGIFCKTHDPKEIERKAEAKRAKWEAESVAINKKYALHAEAPNMLALLKQILVLAQSNGKITKDSMLADAIRKSIDRAENPQ